LTEEDRRLILAEHNYLRQTVATGHVPGQPAAQNMQEMHWDNELAVRAQQWANECTFAHDPDRYSGEINLFVILYLNLTNSILTIM
jgi:Cysteine-rich secretory protein family